MITADGRVVGDDVMTADGKVEGDDLVTADGTVVTRNASVEKADIR